MNVLVVGSGGREYSIGLALKRDQSVEKLYFAPGNGASDELGENIDISDHDELANFCGSNNIDLAVGMAAKKEPMKTINIMTAEEKKSIKINSST